MEPNAELNIDQEIEELELRLERLRSLYEQYFLGIERVEPTVARKDVDRRIWVLRREKFRNTAKRFKLQTIIQRYNTFQQYWQRICREIENGTYKRHLLRAEKIVGPEALTIAAKRRRGAYARVKKEEEAPPEDSAEQRAAKAREATRDATRALEAELFGSPDSSALDSVPSLREPASVKPPAAALKPVPAPKPAPAKPAADLGKLDLDMDDMFGAPAPKAAAPKPAPPAPQRPAPQRPAPPAAPARSAPTAAAKPPPPPARPAPPIPPQRAAPARPPPPQARPAPPPPAAKPPPAPNRAPLPGPVSASLSDQRVRELHNRLVNAQRQTQDKRTVSVEGLAKTLREAENKLRAQHGNRKIDFDVVVKDGKAVVKPILR